MIQSFDDGRNRERVHREPQSSGGRRQRGSGGRFQLRLGNDVSLTTPEGAPATYGEEGTGTGLTVSFDIYRNPGEVAPEFEIMWKGARVAHMAVPLSWSMTGDTFGDVGIRLEADGTVDVQYNGRAIFTNVQLPNFAPIADAYFVLGGRTGGLNANQWIDDLKIVTSSGAVGATVNIARNADGTLTINWNGGGTLQSAPSVLGPWTDLNGVSTGAIIQATGTMQFFRVAQPAP